MYPLCLSVLLKKVFKELIQRFTEGTQSPPAPPPSLKLKWSKKASVGESYTEDIFQIGFAFSRRYFSASRDQMKSFFDTISCNSLYNLLFSFSPISPNLYSETRGIEMFV